MKQSTTAMRATRALANAGMLSVCTGIQEPSASDISAAASVIDEVFDVERELTRSLSAEKRQRAVERASEWIEYDGSPKHGQRLPYERRDVLVQIAGDSALGMPPSVAVGYLRFASDDITHYFVVPGFGRRFVVTHWNDCLGDEFKAPSWECKQTISRASDEATIKIGDRVRIAFWPMKNDLCGDVVYVPTEPGDSWIIRAEGRLFYVQHFATISKRSPNDFGDDDAIT